MRVVADRLDAEREGDMETRYDLLEQVRVPAETLMAFAKCGDADPIREMRPNTSLADEKYGPGWLGRVGWMATPDTDVPRKRVLAG